MEDSHHTHSRVVHPEGGHDSAAPRRRPVAIYRMDFKDFMHGFAASVRRQPPRAHSPRTTTVVCRNGTCQSVTFPGPGGNSFVEGAVSLRYLQSILPEIYLRSSPPPLTPAPPPPPTPSPHCSCRSLRRRGRRGKADEARAANTNTPEEGRGPGLPPAVRVPVLVTPRVNDTPKEARVEPILREEEASEEGAVAGTSSGSRDGSPGNP